MMKRTNRMFSYSRPEQSRWSHKELPFLPEKKVVSKIEKLFCNLNNKENNVVHFKLDSKL